MPTDAILTDKADSTASPTTLPWDRLWRHPLPAPEDDALLARERSGPRWALIEKKLEATFGSITGLQTIELGSGRGDLSALLAQRGAHSTLVDQSEVALSQARRRFQRLGLSAEFVHGDIFRLPGSYRRKFDISLSIGVIEHFGDQQRTEAIRAHHDVLRPGGLAIISVPHARCVPYRLWKFYLERRGWWPYGVELPYGKRELLHRAKRVGFARIDARGLAFWHAVSEHWIKRFRANPPDWWARPSRLDDLMGLVLLALCHRNGAWKREEAAG